ncbi:MAG: TetR/AcrR family transcriptional regulator [Pseudomonadota bacterium]
MPWEKAFNFEDATDAAERVFRRQGYAGTSISDLTTAMGINKGSVYNAYGSKKGVFDTAFARYDEKFRQPLLKRLRETEAGPDQIEAFFEAIVDEVVHDEEFKGCMLINTAMELPHHDDDVAKDVRKRLEDTEAFFREALEAGKANGSLSPDLKIDETARGLMTLLIGLRVMGKVSRDETQLSIVKRQAMQLIGVSQDIAP